MTFFRSRAGAGSAALALLALGTLAACRGDVTPPGPATSGHPVGTSNTRIDAIPGRPFGIRVSSAGRLAVTQQDLNSLTLLDVSGAGARTVTLVGADPGEVIFNKTGSVAIVSGFNDGSVRMASAASGFVTASVTVGGNAYRLALSPDETRLYVSSTDGRIYVINPATPSVIASSDIGGSLQGLALSANGQSVYISSTTFGVSRHEALTLASNATNRGGGIPQDIAVTADGSEVAVANEVGWVDILDGVTLTTKQRIPIPSAHPFGLAISPDDTQIYVTSPQSGQVLVIDRSTRAILRTINVTGTPRRVTFTADGLTALVANEGGWVDVIK